MSTKLVPVNALPSEVLSQIFIYAMPQVKDSLGEIQIPHPANVITSVCSRWRQVSIATSSLWSCINIIRRENDERHRNFLKLVDIWLKRSTTVPLHLHIASTGHHSYTEHTEEIMLLVQPHIPRTVTLQLYRPSRELCMRIIEHYSNYNGHVALADLVIQGHFAYRRVPISPPQRRSELVRPTWPMSALSGLSRLELHNIPANFMPAFGDFVRFLLNMPALRALKLREVGLTGEMDGERPLIVLPKIQELVIDSGFDPPHLQNVVTLVKPGSRRLVVELGSWFHESINATTFFQHANVTTLGIRRLSAGDALGLSQALDYCPQLHWLEFRCASLRSALEPLVKSTQGGTTARCPNLKRLRFHARSISRPAIEELKRVVQAYDLTHLNMNSTSSLHEINDNVLLEWLCQRVQTVSVGDRIVQAANGHLNDE
ncbi:pyrolysin [Ceratobasidium sp. AG-Ba]|nr:pyrolysin [Ceratobasidium sp. AG-Ba]